MGVVDSSALVAIIAPESDGQSIARLLDESDENLISPLIFFETVTALCRIRKSSVAEMTLVVQAFVSRSGIRVEPITMDLSLLALQAFEIYGKPSGHPAKLNLGDCFSYALAKRESVKLFYKGNDFANTDMA